MSTPNDSGGKSSVISVQFKDPLGLHDHFMSHIKGGGLFIETSRAHAMGDELFLLLSLPDNGPRVPVAGKVIWITPEGGRDGRRVGVGVQFTGDQSSLLIRIQNILLTAPIADRATLTF